MIIGFDAKRATQNFTGLGNYSRFVINNLAKYYDQHTYVMFTPNPTSKNIENEIIKSERIKTIIKEGFKPFWRSFGITDDINREHIDVYHGLSNELPFGIEKTSVKTVVTIHDLIFLIHPEFYSYIDRKIYNNKAHYACRVADRIVAVSECTKMDIVKYYGIDPQKIDVVYQGCFPTFKEKVEDFRKNEIVKKYNLPSKFLLSIGSIEDRKNILLIVKALKNIPDIHFVAIGKQRRYAEIVKQYALENGLADRVHLRSDVPIEDLPAILQSSEIFIYPSLYEGFGIPVIEALSSGIPVITSKGSCLEEAGGPHSIYVDPHDDKALSEQISILLENDDLRNKMKIEGLKYVERFTEKECTERLMDVYSNLV